MNIQECWDEYFKGVVKDLKKGKCRPLSVKRYNRDKALIDDAAKNSDLEPVVEGEEVRFQFLPSITLGPPIDE